MAKTENLIHSVSSRASALFESEKHNCAEASFTALNEVFDGGLDPKTAARIATGLGGGLGASGGTCGALTGCVLALGLLAECNPDSLRKKTIYPLAADLQKRFIERFGSCCCSDLIRNKDEERRAYCRGVTSTAVALCAEILLEHSTEKSDG